MIVFIIGLRKAINNLRLYCISEAFHFIVMGNEILSKCVSFSIWTVFTYFIIVRPVHSHCLFAA